MKTLARWFKRQPILISMRYGKSAPVLAFI